MITGKVIQFNKRIKNRFICGDGKRFATQQMAEMYASAVFIKIGNIIEVRKIQR